jgi:hypothetical protein
MHLIKQNKLKMKNFTKILASAAAVVALFFSTNAMAQTPNFGIGVNVGAPTNNDVYKLSLGIDARMQFNVVEQLSIPVTVGYTHMLAKSDARIYNQTMEAPDYGYIPVKAGLKYFFSETGSGLYALGEIGAAFGVTEESKTGFLYAPAVGYSWSNGLDLGVKYEGISKGVKYTNDNIGHVALRLAYGFKL